MSERIRLDPKAVESAVKEADTESSALIAIYRMVYPNWDDIESVGDDDQPWPACSETTWKRICRFFMDNPKTAGVMPGGIWLNNGFSCRYTGSDGLPDWWVMPAPVKLKEKVTA